MRQLGALEEHASLGGSVEASSPNGAQSIRRVFTSASPRVRRCYEAELRRNPDVAGRAMADVSVGPTGRVTTVSVTSTTLPSRVTECIARELRALEFPATSDGPVRIRFPFVFGPAN